MSQQESWAILLCKVKSDASGRFNPESEPPNAIGVLPFRIVCENFFTKADAGFNAVRFFSDMSHGSLDLTDSQVLGWYTLDVNITGYTGVGDPILDKTQGQMVDLARQAANNAGVSLDPFVGVVLIMNLATGWAQGGPGWMAADWRRVDGRNFDGTLGPRAPGSGNGMEIFGQEMGHGYGLGHSRSDGAYVDYQDMWDTMSNLTAYGTSDPDYCARGPGLNAWNMRGRGWLDESRVWHGTAQPFSETVQLRPLYQRDLSGWLAAELPGEEGKSPYLIEFRVKEGWDAGIPESTVLVHRYVMADATANRDDGRWPHSYLMRGTKGQFSLVAGDDFAASTNAGMIAKLKVLSIDNDSKVARVRLSYVPVNPALAQIYVGKNADSRLELFALGEDNAVYHTWQTVPNSGWNPLSFLGGHDLQQIAIGSNADGRLELFALGKDARLYHIWQGTPNGGWGEWALIV